MGNNRGFVLIEVLCSIFILSFCAAVILFSLTTSIKQSSASMQQFKAIELAQGKMDEIVGVEYASIVPVAKTNFPTGHENYQYSLEVWHDHEHGEFLKNIRVTVYYSDSISGLEKTVTLLGARAKN